MVNFSNHEVIGQWPELALIGISPAAARRKPPAARARRAPAILNHRRFIAVLSIQWPEDATVVQSIRDLRPDRIYLQQAA
jgi:hypothetical protein